MYIGFHITLRNWYQQPRTNSCTWVSICKPPPQRNKKNIIRGPSPLLHACFAVPKGKLRTGRRSGAARPGEAFRRRVGAGEPQQDVGIDDLLHRQGNDLI